MVQASPVTVSLTVIVRVSVSPLFANPELLLLVVRAMFDRVGWVLSIVTLLESLVEVTAVPALPASSENAIENVIAPSPSSSAVSITQVHALLDPSVAVTELAIALPSPSVIVHVGEPIASEAVNDRVTSSPSLALPVPAVAILTDDRVGTLASMITAPRSPLAAPAAPPAASAIVPV